MLFVSSALVSLAPARLLLDAVFKPRQIDVSLVPSTRAIVRVVEDAIEDAWQRESSRPGVHLFDGPVCRLEGFAVEGDRLQVRVSQTSYRINVGTNFFNPHFADVFGPMVMANPVGVSCGLISSDGFLVMGRRNGRVAYYPHKVHPFAGSVEVRDNIDLFHDARRELHEEIGLTGDEITGIQFVGIAEDLALRHPETLFIAHTTRTRDQIATSIDPAEHGESESLACDAETLSKAIARDDLTPIAKAIVLRVRSICL